MLPLFLLYLIKKIPNKKTILTFTFIFFSATIILAYSAHLYNVETYWNNSHSEIGKWLNINAKKEDNIIVDKTLCKWKNKYDSEKYLCTAEGASQVEIWAAHPIQYKYLNKSATCHKCYIITSKNLNLDKKFSTGVFNIYYLR